MTMSGDQIKACCTKNGFTYDLDKFKKRLLMIHFDNELIWFKEVNQTTYIDTFKAFNEIQGLTFWREDIDETDVYARKVPDWAQLKNL